MCPVPEEGLRVTSQCLDLDKQDERPAQDVHGVPGHKLIALFMIIGLLPSALVAVAMRAAGK